MSSYHEQLKEAGQFIKGYDEFLLVSHVHPDGDTISSTLAMAHILQSLGKRYEIVDQDPIPDRFRYLPMVEQFHEPVQILKKFSKVITLDVADRKRMGEVENLFADDVEILNIDHHPTNDHFGKANLILPTAAATVEVIYDLMKDMGISLTDEIAACIYTGLLTDTGGFRYSNTSSKVMRIAAELLEYNISPSEIAEAALESISQNHILILKRAFENFNLVEKDRIAMTVLSYSDLQDIAATSDDTEGVVNYMRNIEGVEVGIFFKEAKPEQFKVSLRSKKYIDVGSIAKEFGGGGHARASGFSYNGPLEHIRNEIIEKIKKSEGWIDLD